MDIYIAFQYIFLIVFCIVLFVIGLSVYLDKNLFAVGTSLYYDKKRRDGLEAESLKAGFSFDAEPHEDLMSPLENINLFRVGYSKNVSNVMKGKINHVFWTIFDYKYTIGGEKDSRVYSQTVAYGQIDEANFPVFSLGHEESFHKIGDILGAKDIDFKDNPGFSDKYLLKGSDEAAVRAVFKPHVLKFFEKKKERVNVEASRDKIIIYRNRDDVGPAGLSRFIEDASNILRLFLEKNDNSQGGM